MKASNASLPTGNSRHRAERRALGSHRHHAASKRKGNENPECSDKVECVSQNLSAGIHRKPSPLSPEAVYASRRWCVRVDLCGFASHAVFPRLWLDHIEDQEIAHPGLQGNLKKEVATG